MKINDQLPWTNGQKQQTNQASPEPFERWLESPAKQNSGDEYYWQHQSQLQQSSLHFDEKQMAEHLKTQQATTRDESAFNSPTHWDTKDQSESKFPDNLPGQNPINNYSGTPKLITLIAELVQAMEQSPLPNATTYNQITTAKCTLPQEINTANYTPNNSIDFKNNHLFIHQEQVELTLNTLDLNKQEQKELMQLIQHYLKKKGLVLSRLIVNGVQQ